MVAFGSAILCGAASSAVVKETSEDTGSGAGSGIYSVVYDSGTGRDTGVPR